MKSGETITFDLVPKEEEEVEGLDGVYLGFMVVPSKFKMERAPKKREREPRE